MLYEVITMDDFSDKLVQILNYGSLNLGLGIGYALEIFDVMDEKGSYNFV